MNNNLKQYYNYFQSSLHDLDKERAFKYSLMLLSDAKVSVQELYEEILTPSLNSITISRSEEDTSIWKEHTMTNIVRTIIENAYPFVLKERKKNKQRGNPKKVMILCPEEEYHEIGARMGADYFTMNDYDVCFIGCNTPQANLISALQTLKPDIIAISISNYLNLVSLKNLIAVIREITGNRVMIIISGSAFSHTMKTAKDFGADSLINSYKEIVALGRDKNETGI